jgi:hypothetical protein
MARLEYPGAPEPGGHPYETNNVILAPELADFLRSAEPYVALLHATDRGTGFIAKLPAFEIRAVQGPVPMHLNHQLFDLPAAPVIRTVLTIFDRPTDPLFLEAFTNVADQDQRETFAALSWQDEFLLHFFDEQLDRQLSKRVTGFPQPGVLNMIDLAVDIASRIPPRQFDFDGAKAAVIRATPG